MPSATYYRNCGCPHHPVGPAGDGEGVGVAPGWRGGGWGGRCGDGGSGRRLGGDAAAKVAGNGGGPLHGRERGLGVCTLRAAPLNPIPPPQGVRRARTARAQGPWRAEQLRSVR
jgi:hypothetical protein